MAGKIRYISELAGRVVMPKSADEVQLDEFQNTKFAVYSILQSVGVYPPLFAVNEPLLDNANVLENFEPISLEDVPQDKLEDAIKKAKPIIQAALLLDGDGIEVLYQMGLLKVWRTILKKWEVVTKLWNDIDVGNVVNEFEINGDTYRFKDDVREYAVEEMVRIDNVGRYGWDAEIIASDILSIVLTSEKEDNIKFIEADGNNIIINTELYDKRKTMLNALPISQVRPIWFFFCNYKEVSQMLSETHLKTIQKYMATIAKTII